MRDWYAAHQNIVGQSLGKFFYTLEQHDNGGM